MNLLKNEMYAKNYRLQKIREHERDNTKINCIPFKLYNSSHSSEILKEISIIIGIELFPFVNMDNI